MLSFLVFFSIFYFPARIGFGHLPRSLKGDTEVGAAHTDKFGFSAFTISLYLLICTGIQTNIELQGSMNTLLDWFILPLPPLLF